MPQHSEEYTRHKGKKGVLRGRCCTPRMQGVLDNGVIADYVSKKKINTGESWTQVSFQSSEVPSGYWADLTLQEPPAQDHLSTRHVLWQSNETALAGCIQRARCSPRCCVLPRLQELKEHASPHERKDVQPNKRPVSAEWVASCPRPFCTLQLFSMIKVDCYNIYKLLKNV